MQIKWILGYTKAYGKLLAVAISLVLINAATVGITPWISGQIVDKVIDQHLLKSLMPYLLVMVVVTVIRSLMRYAYQISFERLGQNVLYDLRNQLYQKVQSLDAEFFSRNQLGELMARMTGDMDAIRHFLSWVTYSVLEAGLWFFVAVVMLLRINWLLTLCLLLVTPAIYVLTQHMSKAARQAHFEIRESFARMNSMVEEHLSANRLVRAFAREDYEIQKFVDHNQDYETQNLQAAKVSKRYLPLLDGLAGLLSGILLLVGSLFVIYGQMTLGDLVVFNGFLWLLNQPLRMSGWLINDIERFNAASIRIRELLASQSHLRHTQAPVQSSRLSGKVSFDRVSFAYPDSPDNLVLDQISFTANPGETIGIIGRSGSGKTSLIQLLVREYAPTTGTIKLDDVPIEDYDLTFIRQNMAVSSQEVFLFSDNIAANIAFSRSGQDLTDMTYYAQLAQADHFINQLSEGYDTVIGERGVGLSGGQKQRLSLARALMKSAPILILDDTTSALDMQTESKIQAALTQLAQQTTFIISHRISSVQHADKILVLEAGKLVEIGNHEQLIARQGRYYQLYQQQQGRGHG